MSFLSGIVNFGKAAAGFLGGNSLGSQLVKTAALGYAVRKMSSNAIKDNNSGTNNIDQGVRLQIEPNAESKIPVLYGTAYFGGNVFDARLSDDNKTMWYALALSETTGERLSDSQQTAYTYKDIYLNNQRIVFRSDGITADYSVDKQGVIDRSISGLIEVYCYAGNSDSGVIPENYTGTVPNAYDIFPEWTASTHPVENLVFAVIKVNYNRDKGVTSLGNFLFQIESTMKNPSDVLFDYLTNTRYGAGIPSTEIDTAAFTELENYSNQSVGYTDEGLGSQTLANRYQINGLVDTANPVLENAENLASAAGSWLSFDVHAGKWSTVINKAETSTASFSDDNILGAVNVAGTGLTDLYNSVKVEFAHRDLRDSADFVKIEIPESDRNPNETDATLNITYDNINEPVQAELLAFIELKQSRVDLVIDFETDFSYLGLRAGDVIDVSNARYGFENKLFRITSITERQDDEGALTLVITALEYDADVYTLQDITRFTRTDEDGIVTLGSIGAPTTPQVTKFETDARPRIEIETTTPSGIVEGLEYWITYDDEIANDAERSYTLFATQRPVNGNTFPSGTTVVRDADSINEGNFFIKIRGFNRSTVGAFSDPSGLVEYTPQQVTDAIGPDTSAIDGIGGLATALGVLQLLGSLDDLFGGDSESTLFEKIFDVFTQETGTDIVQQASEGSVGAITVQDDGSVIVEQAKNVDFGTGLTVTDNGSGAITVDVDSVPQQVTQQNLANLVTFTSCPSGAIFGNPVTISYKLEHLDCDKTLEVDYAITGDITASDIDVPLTGTTEVTIQDGIIEVTDFEINTIDNGQPECKTLIFTIGCKSCEFQVCPPAEPQPGDPETCFLLLAETLPVDKSSWDVSCGLAPPLTPNTGSFFIRWRVDDFNAANKPVVTDFEVGSGNYYLYQSDGTLIETLPASSTSIVADRVELPFSDRTPGTDYYITIDAGVVTYCGCTSQKLDDATTLNFTTAPFDVDPFQPMPAEIEAFDPVGPLFPALSVTGITSGKLCDATEFTISFSESIQAGTGSILFDDLATGNFIGGLDISSATISGNRATFSTSGTQFQGGKTYRIRVPEGIVTSDRQPVSRGVCGVVQTFTPENEGNLAASDVFELAVDLQFVDYKICTDPFLNDSNGNCNIRSNVELFFNKPIALGTNPVFELYEDGALIQTFDFTDTYDADAIGEIFQLGAESVRFNPTKIFKPGSSYYFNVAANAIIDQECGNALPAITDSTTISWTTDQINTAIQPPPYDPQESPDPSSQVINYEIDRPVQRGSGEIEIVDDQGNVLGTIPANSPAISIA